MRLVRFIVGVLLVVYCVGFWLTMTSVTVGLLRIVACGGWVVLLRATFVTLLQVVFLMVGLLFVFYAYWFVYFLGTACLCGLVRFVW